MKIGKKLCSWIIMAMIIMFCGSMLNAPSITAGRKAVSRFNTPDEAVHYFMQSLAAQNYDQALACFAVKDMAAHYDFTKMTARTRVFVAGRMDLSPATNELFIQLNESLLESQNANQLRNFIYSIIVKDDLKWGQSIVINDENWAKQFMRQADIRKLKHIRILKIAKPMPGLYDTEINLKIMKNLARIYGADDVSDRLVLFAVGDRLYYTGFQLIRYGSHWRIMRMVSPIGNTSVFGNALPIREDRFEDLIK